MIAKTQIDLKETEYYSNYRYYLNSNGCFFLFNHQKSEISVMDSCRESFGSCWTSMLSEYIGFVSNEPQIEKVNEFFNIIENKLGKKATVTFYKTQNKSIFVVGVPEFWWRDYFHRELFTLFLRCAFRYYRGKTNFQDALDSYSLTNNKNVQKALNAFLNKKRIQDYFKDSISDYVDKFGGVIAFFKGNSTSAIFAL